MSETEKGAGPASGVVVAIASRRQATQGEPFFTDVERARIRAMLAAFEKLKHGCPMARMLLDHDD